MAYLFSLIFLVALITTIVYMVKASKSKGDDVGHAKNKKYAKYAGIVTAVAFVLGGIFGGNLDDSDNAKTSSSSSVVAKKTSSSKKSSSKAKSSESSKSFETSKASSSSSAKTDNVEQANAALVSRLTQSQGWADGKLDENGNPTENGTPNPAYNWAKLITSIKYAENELTIYVNKDYAGLPKTQFASYMTRAENASLNALQEAGIIDDADVQKGLYTRVFDGDTKLAQSKVTDLHQFKINQ